MSNIPVLADTASKLHADIAIVRLIRAGIDKNQISALFPRRRAPNSVCCWLKHFHVVPAALGFPVAAAGVFGRLFAHGTRGARLRRCLEKIGLQGDFAARAIEKLEQGGIVLCVHARNESQAAIAWHIFKHVGADDIVFASDAVASPSHKSPVLAPNWARLAA